MTARSALIHRSVRLGGSSDLILGTFTRFAFEFMPHVGQIDGVWHAAGYSGNGNTLAPWLGHKAALQMIGDPAGETAFSHSELKTRWWYHNRAWFLPFVDVAYRGRDFWNDWNRT